MAIRDTDFEARRSRSSFVYQHPTLTRTLATAAPYEFPASRCVVRCAVGVGARVEQRTGWPRKRCRPRGDQRRAKPEAIKREGLAGE
jgi:hypothetical protein